MPGKHCRKRGRKHTPIVSKAQRGLMGADIKRKRAGKRTKTGMTEADLASHLREAKGKKLPRRKRKSRGNAARAARRG